MIKLCVIKKLLLFLSFVLIILGSCNKEDDQESMVLQENFQIGDEYFSEDNSLKFTVSAIQESRCASDVVCAWAGEAVVEVNVESPFAGTLELSTYDNQIDTLNNYSFELVDVSPYPISTQVIELEDYDITLKIKELN